MIDAVKFNNIFPMGFIVTISRIEVIL